MDIREMLSREISGAGVSKEVAEWVVDKLHKAGMDAYMKAAHARLGTLIEEAKKEESNGEQAKENK